MLPSEIAQTIRAALTDRKVLIKHDKWFYSPSERAEIRTQTDAALAWLEQEQAAPAAVGESPDGLLPCPWCGSESNEVAGEPGMFEILCKCDYVHFAYFHTKAMAVAAWNRRQVPREGGAAPAPDWIAPTPQPLWDDVKIRASILQRGKGTTLLTQKESLSLVQEIRDSYEAQLAALTAERDALRAQVAQGWEQQRPGREG